MAQTEKKLAAPLVRGAIAALVALSSAWETVVAAGELATADNSGTVTNPSVDITTRIKFNRDTQAGATLRLRLAYTGTPSQQLIVVVWGRTGSGAWQRLYNKDPSPTTEVTLTYAASTDATDGTLKYTECDPRTHAWDVDGCEEFIVQIKQAFNGSVTATAFVQGKIS